MSDVDGPSGRNELSGIDESSGMDEHSQRFPGDPLPLSAALDGVMRSLRGPGRAAARGVFGAWDDVVGEAIAAHVQPVRLADGVLVVEVDEPAWATQFRFLADGVRERLAADVGVIVERIDVRVAGGRGLR